MHFATVYLDIRYTFKYAIQTFYGISKEKYLINYNLLSLSFFRNVKIVQKPMKI